MKTIITKLGKTHYTQHYTKLKKKTMANRRQNKQCEFIFFECI